MSTLVYVRFPHPQYSWVQIQLVTVPLTFMGGIFNCEHWSLFFWYLYVYLYFSICMLDTPQHCQRGPCHKVILNKIILDECSTVDEIDHVERSKDCLDWNKLAKLRRHASRVHFAKYTLEQAFKPCYTGEREDIENCWLRAFGPQPTILNVFSFPCFEVRGNSIVS